MIKPLEQRLESLGGSIFTGTTIRSIEQADDACHLHTSQNSQNTPGPYRNVVIALPAYARNRLLGIDEAVETSPITNVHLWFEGDIPLPDSLVGGIGTRGQWYFNISSQMQRDGAQHICAVISAAGTSGEEAGNKAYNSPHSFGATYIEHRRALELSMILDVAHSSPAVVEDVVSMVDRPVVLSHTGVASHCKSPRNVPDALLQRITETGGVIGIGYWADVICDPSPGGVATAIRAAVKRLGENHVSLGSDYDGAISVRFDASELAAVTQELTRTGFTEVQMRKIMGGNLLRVMGTTLPEE